MTDQKRHGSIDAIRNLPDTTPAYVIDQAALSTALKTAKRIRQASGCKILFAIKSFSFRPTLKFMIQHLDGLSASSPFEARMAAYLTDGTRKTVHITSPGIRPEDASHMERWCDYIAFNTYRQWEMHHQTITPHISSGLRVNTRLSFADDPRYDPCRPDSRLGEPIENLLYILDSHADINGLLFHTNCESSDFTELASNVQTLENHLGSRLYDGRIGWLNLGGGYLFHDYEGNDTDFQPLIDTITSIRANGLEVFIEPGAALIRDAGNIVTSVLEIQEHDGHRIAILDTTVNHMPEVFEYQFEPYVHGYDENGEHEYTLAGSTCLAGDIFGTYRFNHQLKAGDRIVFQSIGAYNMVKAHTFNGINLPDIHHLDENGYMKKLRTYTYQDFANRWEERRDK